MTLFWIYAALINPVVMICFIRPKVASENFFRGALLLLPLVLGMAHALVIARVIHQPAFIWLPGARRYFRDGVALTASLAVVVLVIFAQSTVRPALPLFGCAGVILVFFSLGLLWEPLDRWCGSRALCVFVTAVVVIAYFSVSGVRALLLQFPWIVFVLGCGALPVSIALMFDRERVRERARSLLLMFGSDSATLARERLAKQKKPSADWMREPVGQSLAAWRRVFWHERHGARSRRSFGGIALACAVMLMVGLAVPALIYFAKTKAAITAENLAQTFYQVIWFHEAKNPALPEQWLVGAINASCLAIPLTFAMWLTFPSATTLYPVSRRTLLTLSVRITFLRMLNVAGGAVAAIVGVAWISSALAGEAFAWRPTALFTLPLVQMPFLPLIAMVGLSLVRRPALRYYVVSNTGAFKMIVLLILAVSIGGFLSRFSDVVLTPTGVTVSVAAMLFTSALFVFSAKRLFLRSDLLARRSA